MGRGWWWCLTWCLAAGWEVGKARAQLSLEMVSLLPRPQQEAESNLRKAKQGYVQRCEDHDKARLLVAKTEEEQAGTGPGAGGTVSKALDKRRRLEEEAKNKVGGVGGAVQEAGEQFLTHCVMFPTSSCRESPPTLFRWLDFCVGLESQAEVSQCTPMPHPGRGSHGHIPHMCGGCQDTEAGAGGHQGDGASTDPGGHPAE